MAKKQFTLVYDEWRKRLKINRAEIERRYGIPVATQGGWDRRGIDDIYHYFLTRELEKLYHLEQKHGIIKFTTIVRACVTDAPYTGCTLESENTEIIKTVSSINDSFIPYSEMTAAVEEMGSGKYKVIESEFSADYFIGDDCISDEMYPIYCFKSSCMESDNAFKTWVFHEVNNQLDRNHNTPMAINFSKPAMQRISSLLAKEPKMFLDEINVECSINNDNELVFVRIPSE